MPDVKLIAAETLDPLSSAIERVRDAINGTFPVARAISPGDSIAYATKVRMDLSACLRS
jgi:hypothetical protein